MRSTDRRQVDETKLAQNTEINVLSLFARGVNCGAFPCKRAARREKVSSLRGLENAICEGNGLLIPKNWLCMNSPNIWVGGDPPPSYLSPQSVHYDCIIPLWVTRAGHLWSPAPLLPYRLTLYLCRSDVLNNVTADSQDLEQEFPSPCPFPVCSHCNYHN